MLGTGTGDEGRPHELDRAAVPHHKDPRGRRAGRSYAATARRGYLHLLDPHIHLNPPPRMITWLT